MAAIADGSWEPDLSDVRLARADDLRSLVALFAASEVSPVAQAAPRATAIWQDILGREGIALFVACEDDMVIATCMLVTVPNLLRGGQKHGFLENVVTHPAYRGRGHGSAVIRAALAHAWALDCYHVLMQSGRADPRVHAFYEKLGFVGGLRIGYVARPASR